MLVAILVAAIMVGAAFWVASAQKSGGATGVAAIGIAFIVGRELNASWYPTWGTALLTIVALGLFVVGMSVSKENNGKWFWFALVWIPVALAGMRIIPEFNVSEVPEWLISAFVSAAMVLAVIWLWSKREDIRDLAKGWRKPRPSNQPSETPPAP